MAYSETIKWKAHGLRRAIFHEILNCVLSLSWATIFIDSSQDANFLGADLTFSVISGFFLFLHVAIFTLTIFTTWGRNCMENRIIGIRFCILSTASAGIATIVLLVSRWIAGCSGNSDGVADADKAIVFAVLMIVNIDMIRHFELSRRYTYVSIPFWAVVFGLFIYIENLSTIVGFDLAFIIIACALSRYSVMESSGTSEDTSDGLEGDSQGVRK